LQAVLGAYLRDINVALAINCDSIGRVNLSYARKESTGWREFFDAPIASIGDENVSARVNRLGGWRIKLSFAAPFAPFKHVSPALREPAQFSRPPLLCSRQRLHVFLKLANVAVRDV